MTGASATPLGVTVSQFACPGRPAWTRRSGPCRRPARSPSCQVTHGPGLVGRPPIHQPPTGSRRSGWCGCSATGRAPAPPLPRPWPAKIHLPWCVAVVEPAGEDVVGAEAGAGRVLVPGRPRNGPPGAGEVDRRGLAVLALVEVQRAVNVGAALELPPTVPLPRVVHAPLANERVKIWSLCAAAPSGGRPPTAPPACPR